MVEIKTSLIRENAIKLATLAHLFPTENLRAVIQMTSMSPIDINNAVWYALGEEWVQEDLKLPAKGPVAPPAIEDDLSLSHLMDSMLFTVTRLNDEGQDIEEMKLGEEWCQGYASHTIILALELLIRDGRLARYTVTEESKKHGSSEYEYITLPKNLGRGFALKHDFKDNENVYLGKKINTEATLH